MTSVALIVALIILSIRQCRENQDGCYQGAYLANAVVKSVEVHFISGYPTAYFRRVRHSHGGAIEQYSLHV
jgi:hypothetical protein